MNCPSCNAFVGFNGSTKNTNKERGITTCPNCGANFKGNPKRNVVLLLAGSLAFFGGPINNWLLGANETLFGATYAVSVGLFIWFYAMPKSTLIKNA